MFKKVSSRIFSPNTRNEKKMYGSNIVIAPKPMNESQTIPKLKILPAPIKSTYKTSNSSRINCKYNEKLLDLKYVIFVCYY